MDKEDLSLQEAVRRISQVPMSLSEEPWANLLWEPQRNTIINRSINIRTSEKIILYGVGGSLESLKSDPKDLTFLLSTILKRDQDKIVLRKFIK